MYPEYLKNIFKENFFKDAVVWNNEIFSYGYLYDRIDYWENKLRENDIHQGMVTAFFADFSPNSIALLIALIANKCIVVPISNLAVKKSDEYIRISQAEVSININENDEAVFSSLMQTAGYDLYNILREEEHPGLVLFSSGSTGQVKAAVHDLENLLQKFRQKGKDFRTLSFLLFDHIGGLDTLFYSLSNASCLITTKDRDPKNICRLIEKFRVEVLPVSPTFLNLLLLSEAYNEFDLSSLKIITYGTEPMPEYTLKKCNGIFPGVKFIQKFGTTEFGALKSRSKASDSLWVKIGGEGIDIRIVDGMLQIKAQSAMLGYLNAPDPFTADGWFNTGDQVEVDGEYYKILGRKSELINVGGEKVYPAEVENLILQMDNVEDVTVYGEKNPILGNIVCARITLLVDENKNEFSKRLKLFCNKKIQPYKIPVKIFISDEKMFSERYKKKRMLNGI